MEGLLHVRACVFLVKPHLLGQRCFGGDLLQVQVEKNDLKLGTEMELVQNVA